MKPSASAALQVRSLSDPLDDAAKADLAKLLPEYIAGKRWYRSKTRTIEKIEIADVIALPGTRAHLLVLTIRYVGGDSDHYLLALSIATAEEKSEGEVIAILSSGSGQQAILSDALADGGFRNALLEAVVCETELNGQNGVLHASRTSALRENAARRPPLLSRVLFHEQNKATRRSFTVTGTS